VDENGKVIGINYASIAQYEQNFAISRDTAKPVIEQLRSGKNIDSIGVNGIAVSGTINGMDIYGVWVRSVASGSPADKALIQPADIVYQMEGEVLATDGTMKSYCEILRSRNPLR
jgi:serine protease Do